jgi:hypothetical protein
VGSTRDATRDQPGGKAVYLDEELLSRSRLKDAVCVFGHLCAVVCMRCSDLFEKKR